MKPITCADIMVTNCFILSTKATLEEAVRMIHNSGVRYFPLVDEHGNFAGIFSSLTVLRQILPTSSQINMGIQPNDYKFMHTSVEDLRARFHRFSQEPVIGYVEKDYIRCEPDTSLMEAIFQITTQHTHVVICEKDSDKFLGIITINRIFDILSGKE